MSKQDRQGVRTPADIERKYDLGQLKNIGQGGASSEEISRLNQTLSQYMATTNGQIKNLQDTDKSLQEQIDNIDNGGGSGDVSSALVLADQITGDAYKLYMSNGKLMFAQTEITPISQGAILKDEITQKEYKLYVTNGKLMLAESEK